MVHCGMMDEESRQRVGQTDKVPGILRRSTVTFAVKVAGIVSAFVFTFIVSRYYGPDTLGHFSLCINTVQMMVLISLFGFDNTLLRQTAAHPGIDKAGAGRVIYGRLCYYILPAGLLFSVLFYFMADVIAAAIFSMPALGPFFRTGAFMVLPLSLMLLNAAGLRGLNQTGWFAFFRETSRFFLALPMLLPAAFLMPGVQETPVISYMISVLAGAAWSFFLWRKHTAGAHQEGLSNYASSVRLLLPIALPLFMITAMTQLSPILNSLLLGMMGTAGEVGIFNVALRVAGLLSVPLAAVNMATATTFAGLHTQGETGTLQKTATASMRIIFWTSLPMLLICLFAPAMVMNLFGAGFEPGSTALMMLAAGQFVNALTGSVGVMMQMTGHEREWGMVLLITTLLNITGMMVLVPEFGINGAAFCFMMVMIISNVSGAVFLKKKRNIRTYYIPFFNER